MVVVDVRSRIDWSSLLPRVFEYRRRLGLYLLAWHLMLSAESRPGAETTKWIPRRWGRTRYRPRDSTRRSRPLLLLFGHGT